MRRSIALLLALAPASPALAVPVGTSADTRPAAPQHRPAWQEGGVSLQLTGNFLRGNVDLSTVNAAIASNVNRGPHQFFLDGGTFYTAAGANVIAARYAGSALYAYSVRDDLNLYGYSTAAGDQAINLSYRLTQGAGVCLHRLMPEVFSLLLVSANPAYEFERYNNNEVLTVWRGVLRVNGIKPLAANTELSFDTFYTPAFTNLSDYRVYAEASIKVKPWGDALSLKLTAADQYDSAPPVGAQPNDFGVFTTLGVEWGQ